MRNKLLITSAAALILTACGASETASTAPNEDVVKLEVAAKAVAMPADYFDLSHWNITVPVDANNDGKVDIVSVADMKNYSQPDFFHLNEAGHMVFAAPNKALTTPNSSNTRSELRYMSRGSDTKIKTSAPGNNFALKSHPNADEFASIGGRMEATVTVDHVATRAGNPDRPAAYSAVIGQIHSIKDNPQSGAFGFGNEPLKIYFKKYPNHETGSVFWNYERNLPKEDPDRTDIANPVWGNTWTNTQDPGSEGIPLGQAAQLCGQCLRRCDASGVFNSRKTHQDVRN